MQRDYSSNNYLLSLEQQRGNIWYSARHRVADEWVYNHADLMHSKVVWARNLGPEENRKLLQIMPERTVWLVAWRRLGLRDYAQKQEKCCEERTPTGHAQDYTHVLGKPKQRFRMVGRPTGNYSQLALNPHYTQNPQFGGLAGQ